MHREDLTGVVKIPSGQLASRTAEDTKAVLMDGPEQLPSPVASVCVFVYACVCVYINI